MDKTAIKINLRGFNDISTMSASIKSASIKDTHYEFYLDCTDEDFVVFSSYKNIYKYSDDEKDIHFDGYIGMRDKNNIFNSLFYLSHEEDKSRTYVCVLDDSDPELFHEHFRLAVSLTSLFVSRKNISYSVFSADILNILSAEEKEKLNKIISIEDFFSTYETLVFILKKDYILFKSSLNAYLSLMKTEKKKKKSFFSSIGDFFFKNYTRHPENLNIYDYLSFYAVTFEKGSVALTIAKESNSVDYLYLFQQIDVISKAIK